MQQENRQAIQGTQSQKEFCEFSKEEERPEDTWVYFSVVLQSRVRGTQQGKRIGKGKGNLLCIRTAGENTPTGLE